MNKNLILASCLVVAGAILFSGQTQSKSSHITTNPTITQQVETIPEHVRYMFLFGHHRFNMKKAADLEQQGKDGSGFRSMVKRRAGLSDHEAIILDHVTTDCAEELARQDAKAKAVIDAFRERYPVGDLPVGVSLPPPPHELTTMQEERNAIILRARERLHSQLGDAAFGRFNTFVKSLGISSEHSGRGVR